VFARDDALILEPKIEDVSRQQEMVAGLWHRFEEGVKRGSDARRDLA
jgi:hypothetical protein